MKRLIASLVFLLLFAAASGTSAQEPYCGRNPFNRDTAEPFTIALTDWHCPECKPYESQRAGMPQDIRRHAWPSNNPRFWGWWVGGGTAIGGSEPCENDGTWGWDYEGGPIPKRVWLSWSHGRRYQGGTGAYKTDGPKVELHK